MTGKRFDDAFVDDLRGRVGLVDLIGREVTLKRRGHEHLGLCPFHKEKTPSFTVVEGKGFYHCFGCGAHGDAFKWMMEIHGLDFVEAVEELAVRAGLAPDRDGRKPLKPAPKIARPSRAELAADDLLL